MIKEYIFSEKVKQPFSFRVTVKYPIQIIKIIIYKGDTVSLEKSCGKVIINTSHKFASCKKRTPVLQLDIMHL
jgi:hypothetical protein